MVTSSFSELTLGQPAGVLASPQGLFGLTVAHKDITTAALEFNVVRSVCLFNRTPYTRDRSGDDTIPGLIERFGNERIVLSSLEDLIQASPRRPLVFLLPGYEGASLPLLRQGAGLRFPICWLTHSIGTSPHNIAGFVLQLLVARPGDSVVATSRAAVRTLTSLRDDCLRLIGAARHAPAASPLEIVHQPLGVDLRRFDGVERNACRDSLGIDRVDTVILYVGRLAPNKADLIPLLTAFRRLCAQTAKRLTLLLAGQSRVESYVVELREAGEAFGISSRIKLLPNFTDDVKASIYGAADIFVSPVDNVQETFGLTILEAMAAGLPVVASDWSGYRDLVVPGETGLLVDTVWDSDAANHWTTVHAAFDLDTTECYLSQRTVVDVDALTESLRMLIDQPTLGRAFGHQGRQRAAAHFSVENVARQLGSLWTAQWRISESAQLVSGALPDYQRLFGHFASSMMRDDQIVEITTEGKELLAASHHFDMAMCASATALQQLAECALSPRRSGCLRGGADLQRAQFDWLLKNGYLRRSRGTVA